MGEMLILTSMRRKNKNEKLMLTLATMMNGMGTFHKMTSIWRNNVDLWKRQKLLPRRRWDISSSDVKSAARSFMDARKLVAQAKSAR